VTERPKTDALRIAKNALSGAGARIAMMLIGFGLTPFIVNALGLQQFGMWAVIGALAGYLGLLDFGLGGVFVKFLSEYIEQAQLARARQVLTFGMIFYALFGLMLAVPIAFAAPHIVRLFKMPPDQYAGATHVFYALFGLLVLAMVLGLPGAALVAMQRMDLVSRNNFAGYLAYAAGTILLVRFGYGVWGVIGGQAIQIVASCALHWVTARRIFGPMLHHPLKIERAIVRRMLGFGGWTQMTAILNIVSLDVGRFISAGLISVASVSYYELGSKIAFFSRSMPAYLLDAIFPSAAAAGARGDDAAIDQLYQNGTVYSMFVTLGIGGFCIGAADPVLRVWLGQQYPYVAAIVLWLGIGYMISGMTGTGTTIVRAIGMPSVETYFTAVTAAVNLGATAVLATRFGIVGVAGGSLAGWTAGTVYFLIRFHAIRGTSWWKTVGMRIARLTLACAAASGVVAIASAQPALTGLLEHRTTGIAVLLALGAAYSLTYVALTIAFGTWEAHDRRLLRRATRGRLLRFARGNPA
jgi:O-antigen/teichoic acid export membrane protein